MNDATTIVNSVKRALNLLEIISRNQEIGIRELSKKSKLNKSTTHRLVNTLEKEGFLVQNASTLRYRLSFKLFQLGRRALLQFDLRTVIRAILEKMVSELKQSAILSIFEDKNVIYIDKISFPFEFQLPTQVGSSAPMHCTGTGKAILAYLPEIERKEIYNNIELHAYTENTITDFETLEKELVQVRENGYAVDREERFQGIVSVAASFKDYSGKVVGAIGIPGFKYNFKPEMYSYLGNRLLSFVHEIESILGSS